MNEIIAVHGWGFDSSYWKEWEFFFKTKEWIWKNYDRGYYSNSSTKAEWSQSSDKKVVICHSLGFHLIDAFILSKATDIILLNCFGMFLPEGKERRAVKIALEGMKSKIGTKDEKKMLTKFFKLSASPNIYSKNLISYIDKEISECGRHRLRTDLNRLIDTKGLPLGLNQNSKILAIYGKKDQIVSNSSSIYLDSLLTSFLISKYESWNLDQEGHSHLRCDLTIEIERWLKY